LRDPAPRLLFVPVSGRFGMGEYARSLAIAQGVEARWPGAAIHFVLSREAPYAGGTPYPATLLPSSATFHTAEVCELMRSWRPDVVIFDNAGRSAQLRAAKACGASVVYVSARRRQRRKAFRLRWMRAIDEHWIAYPRFIAGGLRPLERLKLRIMRRPRVRFLDVVLARSQGAKGESILARLGCAPGAYALVVPGGGTGHPGAADAVTRFSAAARELARTTLDTVYVGAVGPDDGETSGRLRLPGALPQGDLAELMRGARLVITNGGSTLLQAIACGRPCIAVPIAKDQAERIRRCAAAEVAVPAPLDAAAICSTASALLGAPGRLQALVDRAMALALEDGVDVAVRALTSLVERR